MALQALLGAEEHPPAIAVQAQPPGVGTRAQLTHPTLRVKTHGAVAQRGRPHASAFRGGDVHDPAGGQSRGAIERLEFPPAEADHTPVLRSEPDVATAHCHPLERRRSGRLAPATDHVAPFETQFVQRGGRGDEEPPARKGEAVGATLAHAHLAAELAAVGADEQALSRGDRKSTRLNSSHITISYAVFCLKKKTKYDIAH